MELLFIVIVVLAIWWIVKVLRGIGGCANCDNDYKASLRDSAK